MSNFLPAYEETTVPSGDMSPEFPYLTYSLSTSSFDEGEVPISVSLWYRGTSWSAANKKADEISEYIGNAYPIKCNGGNIWIKRGTPFAQNMGDDSDDMIRRKLINLTVEYNTKY